jgi:hypothetical protein
MRMSAERLYELLPAIYRIRDAEEGYPLREFISVLAEQAAVIEENIEQLYDDQFIETCADWVAPYVGGLIGYRPLHGVAPGVASPRSEVANIIARRDRLVGTRRRILPANGDLPADEPHPFDPSLGARSARLARSRI